MTNKKLLNFNYKGVKFKIINTSFGSVNVKKLIKLKTELELFNFYIKYKKMFKSFADIGANVGIHSLFGSRLFKTVYSYEPLSDHFHLLEKNIKLNRFKNIKIFKKAISVDNKNQTIIILTKNTTATHLSIAHRSKYGKIKKEVVKCDAIKKISKKADLIKLDVEGLESKLIKKINFKNNFSSIVLEVHNYKNSKEIFNYLSNKSNVSIYKLKNSKLKKIKLFKEMPKSTKEGSLFITNTSFVI